jgi:F0F1-type ATP synthase assembly protein I
MSSQGSPREEAARPARRRSVAGRRQQTWASRWNGGQPEGASATSRGTGSEVASYVIAGLLAYGGIGWLVAHFTHIQLFFPIGMLVGVALSLGWVVYRYGRR